MVHLVSSMALQFRPPLILVSLLGYDHILCYSFFFHHIQINFMISFEYIYVCIYQHIYHASNIYIWLEIDAVWAGHGSCKFPSVMVWRRDIWMMRPSFICLISLCFQVFILRFFFYLLNYSDFTFIHISDEMTSVLFIERNQRSWLNFFWNLEWLPLIYKLKSFVSTCMFCFIFQRSNLLFSNNYNENNHF